MQIECYAQRLLNPFRGVVHIIRYQSAEAVTTDGIEWDIYVANDALLDGLGRAGKRAQISDIRYGHWSAEKGLKRGPLYPSDDFKRLEDMGAVVYEHLLQGASRRAVQIPRPVRAVAARPQRPAAGAAAQRAHRQRNRHQAAARLARRHGRAGTLPERGDCRSGRIRRGLPDALCEQPRQRRGAMVPPLRRRRRAGAAHAERRRPPCAAACWRPMPSRRCSSPPPAWMPRTPGWCTTITPGRRRGCCCCRISTRPPAARSKPAPASRPN